MGIRHGGDEFKELLGHYELSFLSGIADFGRCDPQKSLAEDKGCLGSRDWDSGWRLCGQWMGGAGRRWL